ncbi:MAG: hypothetical protein M1829_003550 [Trizodia sp. TS-e1964]|nr:MAG: hypothetical protein M1829_003550 [Trizodia sp. TS-e1964]
MLSSLFLSSALALLAAADQTVTVGQNGLKFNPESITAAVGEKITFQFYPNNHSVVAAAFDSPCTPRTGANALFSGFSFATASGQSPSTFVYTVASTNATWLYCSQGRHCQSGMVAVINPPTSGNRTLAAFRSAAALAPNNVSPSVGVTGGSINGTSTTGTTNGTSTSTTGSTSSTSTAGGSSTSTSSSAGSTGTSSSSSNSTSSPTPKANAASTTAIYGVQGVLGLLLAGFAYFM